MANATLTRNVLEMVKLLNYGMQVTEAKELPLVEAQIEALAETDRRSDRENIRSRPTAFQ